jgi:CheY-like chemotaxis protein
MSFLDNLLDLRPAVRQKRGESKASKNPGGPVVVRRKVLLVGIELSLRDQISTFLTTMDWACTVVRDAEECLGVLQREDFDAVVIDLGRCESLAERAIRRIKEVRPSLEYRIVVINDHTADGAMLELVERHCLIQAPPLQRLGVTLRDLCAVPRSSELSGHRMPVAQIIFDSSKSLLPAGGIRSVIAGPRQLAFQHQDTAIDLSIEHEQESRRVRLSGQILDCKGKRKNDGLSVLLISSVGTVARTATNEFGKFYMQLDSPGEADLEIRLGEQSWVLVQLGELGGVGKSSSAKESTPGEDFFAEQGRQTDDKEKR